MKTLTSHMFWPSLIIYEISLPRVLFWILPHVDPLSVSPNSYWLCLPPPTMCCRPIFCKCWNTKTPILFPCKCEHGWLNVFHHSFSLNIDVSATFAFNWILGMPGQTFISGEWQPCSTCFCGHRLSSSWCPHFYHVSPPFTTDIPLVVYSVELRIPFQPNL